MKSEDFSIIQLISHVMRLQEIPLGMVLVRGLSPIVTQNYMTTNMRQKPEEDASSTWKEDISKGSSIKQRLAYWCAVEHCAKWSATLTLSSFFNRQFCPRDHKYEYHRQWCQLSVCHMWGPSNREALWGIQLWWLQGIFPAQHPEKSCLLLQVLLECSF